MAQPAKVWEGAIRLFHWLLALAILGLFITAYTEKFYPHIILGKIVLGLVIFRILWGFVGSRPTRLMGGLCSLLRIPSYLGHLFSRKAEYTVGHTPLGWGMTFALLLAAGTQALLGLSMEHTHEGVVYGHELSPLFADGKLKEFFNHLHTEVMPPIIITLVVVHILAILWYRFGKGQNLLPAMISGVKMVDTNPKTNFKKLVLPSVVVAVVAVGLTLLILASPHLLGLAASGS